mmetsp:Transcript_126215/g.288915  ORF Transcript_126215/g.288915 Transcript_126215/m.288915 type:complete len:92 (+) Transcript_126215:168-443(+)
MGDGNQVASVASITGDSQILVIRGKPRVGFELVVKVKLSSGETLTVKELDSTDLEGYQAECPNLKAKKEGAAEVVRVLQEVAATFLPEEES